MLTLRGSGSSGCKRAATTPRLRNKNDEEELGDNTALPTLRFRLLQRQYSCAETHSLPAVKKFVRGLGLAIVYRSNQF